jgi:hypothetical protein
MPSTTRLAGAFLTRRAAEIAGTPAMAARSQCCPARRKAMLRRTTQLVLGTALVAAAATFAPAVHAGGVGFNVSIAGPGYGVSFGNAPYYGHRHYYQPYYRPAYVAPPVVYAPAPYYAPPVVYPAPRVVYRAPYVVRRPAVVYYGY